MNKLRTRQYIILLFFVFCAVAVNLTKPVHIDDTAYLEIAQAIIRHPLHPLSQEINWENKAQPIFYINQPLFVPYVYAFLIKLFGESEFILHLFIAICSGFAIYLFYLLADYFQIRHSLFLTGLFALGPSFLPGQNLMVDMPLMVSWLSFFVILLSRDDDNKKQYFHAGIAVAISCMIKYTSLVLLPIMFVMILYRRHWKSLLFLGIPVVTLVLWSIFNYYDFGSIHILGRYTPPLTLKVIIYRIVSWVAGTGSVSPFVLSIIDFKKNDPAIKIVLLMSITMGVVLGIFMMLSQQAQYLIYWSLFFAGGVLVHGFVFLSLARNIRSGLQEKDSMTVDQNLLLGLWIVGTFAFIVMFSPFMAIRHILLVMPVFLLIIGQHLSRYNIIIPREIASFMLTVFLGISLAISDYFYADIYRNNAYKIRNDLPQNAQVYQVGHWGWQWYSIKAGMIQYDRRKTRLKNSDYLVVALDISKQRINPSYMPHLQVRQQVSISAPTQTWIRTMYDRGYYSFQFPTSPPWHLSKAPFKFVIYQFVE